MARNFSSLGKETDNEVQESQRVPSKMSPKRKMPKRIIVKMVKGKRKSEKRKKKKATYYIKKKLHKFNRIFFSRNFTGQKGEA